MKFEVEKSGIRVDGNPFYYVFIDDKEYHVLGNTYTAISKRTPYWSLTPREFRYELNPVRHAKVIEKIQRVVAHVELIGFGDGSSVKGEI